MFCINCGAEIQAGVKFCGQCGSAINSSEVDKSSNTNNENVLSSLENNEQTQRKNNTSTDNNLIKAFKLRQKDTGWGRAFAHWIPFYGIYYAFSRRTITPWGLYMIVSFFSIMLSLMLAEDVVPNESQKKLRRSFMIAVTPLVIKYGINKSRDHAKRRLDQIESDKNKTIS